MAVISIVSQVGSGFAPSSGVSAPNVLNTTTAAAAWRQKGHDEEFSFSGTVQLPTTNPDYSTHFKRLQINAINPAGVKTQICDFNSFTGTSFTYLGLIYFPQPTGALPESWKVEFVAFNEDGSPTDSPLTKTVSVDPVSANIVAVASTSELANSRWQDSGTALHVVVSSLLDAAAIRLPTTATIWTTSPQYGRIWHGWFNITAGSGLTIHIGEKDSGTDLYAPDNDETWTVTACGGAIDSNVAPPSYAVTSAGFTMAAAAAPGSTDATNASVDTITYAPGSGGASLFGWDHLYVTLPLDKAEFWFARLTVQTGAGTGGSFVPGGAHPVETNVGDWATDTDHGEGFYRVGTSNQIYNTNPNYWVVPSDTNITHRFRWYITSRRGGPAGTTTLQNCWSGASYGDMVVDGSKSMVQGSQINGGIPASNITSVTASVINGGIQASQVAGVYASTISGGIQATQINGVFGSVINGGIAASNITAVTASVINGGIQASQISSVYASTLSGQVLANQINAVYGSTISGPISASNITSVTGSVISGPINASNITNVQASAIQGFINSSNINSVQGSVIQGFINSSNINSVQGSVIQGAINSTAITSVQGSVIQGFINSSNINSVQGSVIQGAINATSITNVQASVINGVIVTSQLASQIINSVSLLSGGIFGPGVVSDGSVVRVSTTDTSNMASNPDFEYDLKDWDTVGGTIVTAPIYSGSKAVHLVGPNQSVTNHNLISCKPGDQFVLQTYVRCDQNSTGQVSNLVRFLDHTGVMISDGPWGFCQENQAWPSWYVMQTSGIATAPNGAAQVQIYAIYTASATGNWYVDNVLLKRAVDSSMIASVDASVINGTISAAHIGGVQASLINGLIIAGQISTLNASVINGQINISNLTSISVSQLAGNLDISRVNNVSTINIGTLQGNLDASRVANLSTININTFSGTIGTINSDTVFIGGSGFKDGQIHDVNVSKLVAGNATFYGTATFSRQYGGMVTLDNTGLVLQDNSNAPTTSVKITSNAIKLTNSSTGNTVRITNGGVGIYSNWNNAGEYNNTGAAYVFIDASTGVRLYGPNNSYPAVTINSAGAYFYPPNSTTASLSVTNSGLTLGSGTTLTSPTITGGNISLTAQNSYISMNRGNYAFVVSTSPESGGSPTLFNANYTNILGGSIYVGYNNNTSYTNIGVGYVAMSGGSLWNANGLTINNNACISASGVYTGSVSTGGTIYATGTIQSNSWVKTFSYFVCGANDGKTFTLDFDPMGLGSSGGAGFKVNNQWQRYLYVNGGIITLTTG